MSKYAQYFAIEKKLKQRGFNLEREELISMFTQSKKESLRELTTTEYHQFIQWLNENNSDAGMFKISFDSFDREVTNKQRRKIIAFLAKVGFITSQGKADMPRIYDWVQKYGYLSKGMNQYTMEELPKLVYQAEQFYKSHIERL